MKTKEQGWKKASFDVKLAYQDDEKHIKNGRIYKCFGLDMSYKSKGFYHLPTKSMMDSFDLTLKELKSMVDNLMEINIDWTSTDNQYYAKMDKEIVKQIRKIFKGEI